jgi:hypothetical protein
MSKSPVTLLLFSVQLALCVVSAVPLALVKVSLAGKAMFYNSTKPK